MANGKHGDHPLTDILIHKVPVFSSKADNLIIQLSKFVPIYKMHKMFDWFSPPPLDEFEKRLEKELNKLKIKAKKNGWEVE